MSVQLGAAADAAGEREAMLVQRTGASASADRVAVTTVQAAHATAFLGLRQLDTIEREIDRAVAYQRTLALDTPAGARNFLKFLAVKQQDIAQLVSETAADSEAKAALLQSLSGQYATTRARGGLQMLGTDARPAAPEGTGWQDSPFDIKRKPWEYNLDLTSGIEVAQPPLPGLVNAGTVTGIDDVWNELQRCFNCNFPMGGAPPKIPNVGDDLPLEIRVAGQKVMQFPVKVTQFEKTADEINIEFRALPGHIDGAGSTIHFKFYQQGGQLHLAIRGYITTGPGSEDGWIGAPERVGYTEVARAVWRPYIDNITKHVAQSRGLPTYEIPR